MYSLLRVNVAFLLSLILLSGVSFGSQDFDLSEASLSVVKLTVNRTGGRDRVINGVAISPSIIVTTKEAVEGLVREITVQGDRATLSRQFDDQNLALISYPRGGLTPVTLAASMGVEGRQIHSLTKSEAGTELVSGEIVNLVSENTREGGYYDGSMAPGLIKLRQAVVFNNCGELIGLFDRSLNRNFAVIKGLDDLTGVAISTARHKISDQICPSENEKRLMREEQAKQEAAEKAQQSAKALEEAEAAAKLKQQAAEAALKEEASAALKKAEAEAEAKSLEAEEEAERQRLEAETKLEQNKKEAEESQAKADEALKLSKEEAKLKEEEAAKLLEEQRRDYLIVLFIIVVIALAIYIPLSRRKKKMPKDGDEGASPNYNESGSDLIIRGPGFTIKVPEELLVRERGVVIGRSAADCDFVVDAPAVSRMHVRLTQREQIIYVEDLGSANGTNLNGLRLQSGQPVALHDKDDLELSDSLAVVEVRRR
jgi:hypothetical protein